MLAQITAVEEVAGVFKIGKLDGQVGAEAMHTTTLVLVAGWLKYRLDAQVAAVKEQTRIVDVVAAADMYGVDPEQGVT